MFTDTYEFKRKQINILRVKKSLYIYVFFKLILYIMWRIVTNNALWVIIVSMQYFKGFRFQHFNAAKNCEFRTRRFRGVFRESVTSPQEFSFTILDHILFFF